MCSLLCRLVFRRLGESRPYTATQRPSTWPASGRGASPRGLFRSLACVPVRTASIFTCCRHRLGSDFLSSHALATGARRCRRRRHPDSTLPPQPPALLMQTEAPHVTLLYIPTPSSPRPADGLSTAPRNDHPAKLAARVTALEAETDARSASLAGLEDTRLAPPATRSATARSTTSVGVHVHGAGHIPGVAEARVHVWGRRGDATDRFRRAGTGIGLPGLPRPSCRRRASARAGQQPRRAANGARQKPRRGVPRVKWSIRSLWPCQAHVISWTARVQRGSGRRTRNAWRAGGRAVMSDIVLCSG